MEQHSEQDLQYAAEFREGVHAEALARIQKLHPEIEDVVDRWPVEAYFQEHWDYPGKWYPRIVVEYRIVPGNSSSCRGCEAHRQALEQAFRKLSADSGEWSYDIVQARGKQIDAAELFAPARKAEELNYRGAFLHPPHGTGYTDADFDRVNAALFPNGTDGLEVYKWTTDWSEYFDDGHEWWGALCLTVYDKTLERFVVILASATD